jgi:type VI secretion system secreted protein VgrG
MAIAVTVSISVAGGPPLRDYHSVSIRQELFGHHSFQVAVPYEILETERSDGFFHQAHQNYCGKPVTITITPVLTKDPPLLFKGTVTHIALSNSGDFAHSFVLSGFSPTYLLEDGTQRRTFQKKGLKDIFEEVLKPYGKNVITYGTLTPQHQDQVKYTVQYGESTYTFLRRLADEYGEWFYYDGQTLRLGQPTDDDKLAFTVTGTEGFAMAIELLPTKFALSRYDYLAHTPYKGTSESQTLSQLNPFAEFALTQSNELFAQPAQYIANRHVRSQAQLDTTIKEWKENQVSGLVTFQGTGENPGFGVGKVVAVQGATVLAADGTAAAPHDYGQYRLTEVTHTVQADQYQNAFVALPDAAKHPAANKEVHPPQGVPELAEVIDVADPQNVGRIRVRYYWPVAEPAEAETGWVRVSTPYSGNGKGQLFTPEVGSQVLVGYEHGLAEFPVVLGNLFHPKNSQNAKYTFPQNNLKGMQTAGGNKFVMSEVAGAQTILLSNSNKKGTAMTISFAGDGSVHIQSEGPVTVNGSVITLGAGVPGKGETAYTGQIIMRAKTITMAAEEEVKIDSLTKTVTVTAKTDLTAKAEKALNLTSTGTGVTVSGGPSVDIKAGKVKVNS